MGNKNKLKLYIGDRDRFGNPIYDEQGEIVEIPCYWVLEEGEAILKHWDKHTVITVKPHFLSTSKEAPKKAMTPWMGHLDHPMDDC